MLQQLSHLLTQGCHMAGMLMVVIGALIIGLALMGNLGPFNYLRGFALILFGTWFSGLAG